ncbi:hypothetical protein L202_03964 [Cryptococcus amylolentus CBS 6039]|uniref:RTA1 like protein n=2 Tax=Cryptococcus amylolentus TaxID=104669 RepID=A0A1E3HPN9_9TREE|nr:hypothetical protein L202_03964 [Cryptococcus amylolentus CBS 6039]ODN78320.1 hypothetical protein L202_03964 [Cryptococcus amylolentus CBS 6039]ODO07083.1 hypothetical protein I350_04451 [Cryptococcus amylolentus CBS 6273]
MGRGDYNPISPYGYTPTEWVTIVFLVIFSVSGAVHLAQGVWGKYYIVFPTLIVGLLLEIIGWVARLWSSRNVLYDTPFLMQIITLIIAPVFFSAYCYTILGVAIQALGKQYSLLRANWYVAIFVTCDVISLVLQAVGGGWAASSDEHPVPHTPTNIMVGGIIFQLVTMIVFCCLAADFMWRAASKKAYKSKLAQAEKERELEMGVVEVPDSPQTADSDARLAGKEVNSPYSTSIDDAGERRKRVRGWWFVMLGVGICSICIIVRGIYRTVELLQGWDGYLISHEVYQDVLDGIPMSIAIISINVFHPAHWLSKRRGWIKE